MLQKCWGVVALSLAFVSGSRHIIYLHSFRGSVFIIKLAVYMQKVKATNLAETHITSLRL